MPIKVKSKQEPNSGMNNFISNKGTKKPVNKKEQDAFSNRDRNFDSYDNEGLKEKTRKLHQASNELHYEGNEAAATYGKKWANSGDKELDRRNGKYSEGTSGIKTKPKNNGDLKPDKDRQKARAAAFSPTANARVAQAKQQASNGFKGESLNDHGLPDGHKSRPIIQSATDTTDAGAKFRRAKYQDGSKGIKTKKAGGMYDFINEKGAKTSTQVKEMKRRQEDYGNYESTKQLDSNADSRRSFAGSMRLGSISSDYRADTSKAKTDKDRFARASNTMNSLAIASDKVADSLSAESGRRKKASGKYSDGTKGIKTKKNTGGMNNFIHGEADRVKKMSDKDLEKALISNLNPGKPKNAMANNLLDETVNRKWRKQGGYSKGSKGIKTKKMC